MLVLVVVVVRLFHESGVDVSEGSNGGKSEDEQGVCDAATCKDYKDSHVLGMK